MTVYIPSYFKNFPERKELFYKCVNSYLNLGFNIVVYWMNLEGDKIIDERIKYIDFKRVVNASVARNYLLNIFYESDDDEAIFSDDDSILNGLDDVKDIDFDVLSLVNDKRGKLVATAWIYTCILIVKNLNKKYGKKVYFDESLDSNQDLDFGINLKLNKFKVFILNTTNITINKGKSVMFENQMQRLCEKNKTLQIILKKWGLKEYKWI